MPQVCGTPDSTARSRSRSKYSRSRSGRRPTCSWAISKMPRPVSPTALTMARTSSQSAARLATGRSSAVTWLTVRDVEKPMAPAAYGFLGEPAHGLKLVRRWRLRERALAHDVGPERRVPDVAGVVDALRERVDGVQELRERLPRPVDAGQHGVARDVLGALQVAEHEVRFLFPARGDGESAVAHHDAGDTVVARTRPETIPEDLRVHVRMAIDEAGRDDVALGVHGALGAVANTSDGGDPAVLDRDVGDVARCARAVDHRAVGNNQVVGHGPPTVQRETGGEYNGRA